MHITCDAASPTLVPEQLRIAEVWPGQGLADSNRIGRCHSVRTVHSLTMCNRLS